MRPLVLAPQTKSVPASKEHRQRRAGGCIVRRHMATESPLSTPASLPMPADRPNNFWYVDSGADTVVVFVHGIFSSSRSCWLFEDLAAGRSVFWPDLVRTDPRLRGTDIYLGGYFTSVDSADYSLPDCATELRDAMLLKEVGHARPPYAARRIVFVCHSTGGIVVRYLIQRYKHELRDKAVGLALIASPSLGSKWADVFAAAAEHNGQRLGRQLSWDDSALQALHWEFSELVAPHNTELPGLFGREAAEHYMIGRSRFPRWLRRWLPTRHKVVEKLSAAQYFGQVRQISDTDHFSIVKPSSVDHPSHQFLVGFMHDFRNFADKLPPIVAAPPAATDATIVKPAHPPLDGDDWPVAAEQTVHLFVSTAGFAMGSSCAVLSCVVVDGLAAFEAGWRSGIASMLEDPHRGDEEGVDAALRRQNFGYTTAPALRPRIARLLGSLGFESYVGFARRDTGAQATQKALLDGVVFDRLRGYRTRTVVVHLRPDVDDQLIFASLKRAVVDNAARVRELHDDGRTPEFEETNARAIGAMVAEHVAAIVRERLERGKAATDFNRIHPAKLRVIYELETGEYFTRHNPFTG
jgi:pimeloyl-ACP methyl ester carboxylesterase